MNKFAVVLLSLVESDFSFKAISNSYLLKTKF